MAGDRGRKIQRRLQTSRSTFLAEVKSQHDLHNCNKNNDFLELRIGTYLAELKSQHDLHMQ